MAKLNLAKSTHIDLLGPTIICLLVNLIIIAIVLLLRNNLPPVIPLLYGEPKGEDQLVPRNFLMLPPIMVTVITIVNTVLSRVIKDHFIQQLLFGFTVVTTLLSTVTVIRIILLII